MAQTTIASFKNWPAICMIQNALLRLLVATTEDEEVLSGLRAGFPQLFCDTPSRPRVPASALTRYTREHVVEEHWEEAVQKWYASFDWSDAAHHFHIPTVAYFAENEVRIPNEIEKQLVGQKALPGVRVMYEGIECLAIEFRHDDAIPLGGVMTVEYIKGIRDEYFLSLIPANCVDLDS